MKKAYKKTTRNWRKCYKVVVNNISELVYKYCLLVLLVVR